MRGSVCAVLGRVARGHGHQEGHTKEDGHFLARRSTALDAATHLLLGLVPPVTSAPAGERGRAWSGRPGTSWPVAAHLPPLTAGGRTDACQPLGPGGGPTLIVSTVVEMRDAVDGALTGVLILTPMARTTSTGPPSASKPQRDAMLGQRRSRGGRRFPHCTAARGPSTPRLQGGRNDVNPARSRPPRKTRRSRLPRPHGRPTPSMVEPSPGAP